MFRNAALRHREAANVLFELHVVTTSVKPSLVQLKGVIGPGDAGEPVITILLPEED
jgi:hypothetical protein